MLKTKLFTFGILVSSNIAHANEYEAELGRECLHCAFKKEIYSSNIVPEQRYREFLLPIIGQCISYFNSAPEVELDDE